MIVDEITLGRNVAVKLTGNLMYDRYLLHHETGHLSQINDMGAGKFYGRTIKEYTRHFFGKLVKRYASFNETIRLVLEKLSISGI